MKKIIIAALLCTSLLMGEELFSPPIFTNPSREELIPPQEDQSKFFYAAGGINPFPTVSLGFRTLYGHSGSDLSLSASLFLIPVPGLLYKQLFFTGKSWQECKQGHSAFYLGPQVGVYISGSPIVGAGAFLGWQFKRENRADFFELGVTPLVFDRHFVFVPLPTLSYAFMF